MEKPWMCIRYWKLISIFILVFLVIFVPGCNPALSSSEELQQFAEAGPSTPETGFADPSRSKFHTGPYRIIPGDLLEFQIPAILRIVSPDLSELLQADTLENVKPYFCRVNEAGDVIVPIAGELPVAGRTVSNVEQMVIDAYYPKYVVDPPMVVCKVSTYQNENERVFTVMGLVNHPDAFPYPPDVQYNLMEALAFARGFNLVADPKYVKIYRKKADGDITSATFKIDNKTLADAYNVIIKPGDVVFVDHTVRTRTNTFLSNVISIGIGADARVRP